MSRLLTSPLVAASAATTISASFPPLASAATTTTGTTTDTTTDTTSNKDTTKNNNGKQQQKQKQTNLSDAELIAIVVDKDLVENQFLVNGNLTRSVYDETCTFTDEIDTYGLDQWQSGTARLFDGGFSRVLLVPGSVQTTNNNNVLSFRFVEYLCFNVPVLKPIVYLSGTLFLTRSDKDGLITKYQEVWDQDVKKVLTSESKLFTSNLSRESLDRDLAAFFETNANAPVQ